MVYTTAPTAASTSSTVIHCRHSLRMQRLGGQTGSNLGRVDVNCDGVVDDADLLQVLFNFGGGC